MELLVVRHAIAFERSARRWPDDAQRPLSPQGAARARKAALGLKRVTEHPARVLVSPLRRAQQTAAILTQFAGWPEAGECVQLLPRASPEGLLALLEGDLPSGRYRAQALREETLAGQESRTERSTSPA